MSSDNLNKSIVKGVSWNLLESLSLYIIRFVIGIVLARLLSPSDYGLIAMLTIFLAISEKLVTAGFGQAYVKKKDADNVDATTIFWINMSISLILYIALFFGAPLISRFFHQEQLTLLLRVLAIIIIIRALNVIQYAMIRKNMQFKRKAIITTISSVGSGIIGVACAYSGLGVWSLVIQQISSNAFLCILFYLTSKWKPSLLFSFASAKAMFSYGGWLFLCNLFETAMNYIYKVIIGRRYDSSDLGLYERGHQYPSLVSDTFTWIFGVVAFPSMTKIQDDKLGMHALSHKYVLYSCLIIFPLITWLMIAAEPLVLLLITDKWIECVPYLRLVCIATYITPVVFFFHPLLQAFGFSKRDFETSIVLAFLRIINVLFAIKMGIMALLYGEIIVMLSYLIIISLRNRKILGHNYLTVIWDIKWIIVATLFSVVAGSLLMPFIGGASQILQIILSFIVVYAVFIIILTVFQRNVLFSGLSIIKMVFNKK